jgi:histone deacetylase complex subunit SAP18
MEETSNNRDRSPAEDHASSSNKMSIDRVKTCPFLLRCFWKMNKHNIPSDYRNVSRGIFPNQEVQIYTWLNASVKEISELLKNVIQPMQENSHATLSFSAVYVDEKGFFAMRKVHTSLLPGSFVVLINFLN